MVFLVWQDGRLSDNLTGFIRDIRQSLQRGGEAGDEPGGGVRWHRLHQRIKRLEGMVKDGDGQVQVHLESMRDEMNSLRKYANETLSGWFAGADQTLGEVRSEFGEKGPEAADKLRQLSADLKMRFISSDSSRKREAVAESIARKRRGLIEWEEQDLRQGDSGSQVD